MTPQYHLLESNSFQVGIYARLSVEGSDAKNESIHTQIELAKQYIDSHPEMKLYQIYVDLGVAGTHFSREGFSMLMRDLRDRKINCVIVKDLSRFGRNYVETGNYIQKIFPFMKVRFVAIADGIDTFDLEYKMDDLTLGLKNLVNEMYVKDISRKVMISKKTGWETGSFTGGICPYGYQCEWKKTIKHLVTDSEAADIVKMIFRLYLEGCSVSEIVCILYENRIHPPMLKRVLGHVFCSEEETLYKWNRETVKNMLSNPVYMGCLVKKKMKQDIPVGTVLLPDENNTDIQFGTHEAIVSREVFLGALRIMGKSCGKRNKSIGKKCVPIEENVYQGLLYCGECKKKMTRITNVKTRRDGEGTRWYGYRCGNHNHTNQKCFCKSISKRKLDEMIKELLVLQLAGNEIDEKTVMNKWMNIRVKTLLVERKKTEQSLSWLERRLFDYYMQYRAGEITDYAYEKKKTLLEVRKSEYQEKDMLCKLKTEKRMKEDSMDELWDYFFHTREGISLFIKQIELYGDNRAKVRFAFKRESENEKRSGVEHE